MHTLQCRRRGRCRRRRRRRRRVLESYRRRSEWRDKMIDRLTTTRRPLRNARNELALNYTTAFALHCLRCVPCVRCVRLETGLRGFFQTGSGAFASRHRTVPRVAAFTPDALRCSAAAYGAARNRTAPHPV